MTDCHRVIDDSLVMEYALWELRCDKNAGSMMTLPSHLSKMRYCPFCGEGID